MSKEKCNDNSDTTPRRLNYVRLRSGGESSLDARVLRVSYDSEIVSKAIFGISFEKFGVISAGIRVSIEITAVFPTIRLLFNSTLLRIVPR